MIRSDCDSSIEKSWASAVFERRSLAAVLIAALLAAPGCGGSPAGQAAPPAGLSPDEQAKQSRDYSRALHEKTKGRPAHR